MTKCLVRCLNAAAAAVLIALPAKAALITDGFTFAVASSGSDQSTGTHFHSSSSGVFGNPAGKAEVGRFSSEEVRGLSEYNIAGLTTVSSAFVTFDVYKAGGLFAGTNDTPFTGTIQIVSYAGNNAENISDYQAPATATIGSFSTAGLTVGSVISFDITSALNALIASSSTSLGIRLEAVPLNTTSQAWTFDTFRLTSDSQCTSTACESTPPATDVPAPAAVWVIMSGLVALGATRRFKRNA